MSDLNQAHNRVVWFDIPVLDLARACDFYRAVLACDVQAQSAGGFEFAVLEHDQGNGGCLVPMGPGAVAGDRGPLLYLNVEGRLRDALEQVRELGATVLQDAHAIGPHGFRAVVLDSEGNRVALHSSTDA